MLKVGTRVLIDIDHTFLQEPYIGKAKRQRIIDSGCVGTIIDILGGDDLPYLVSISGVVEGDFVFLWMSDDAVIVDLTGDPFFIYDADKEKFTLQMENGGRVYRIAIPNPYYKGGKTARHFWNLPAEDPEVVAFIRKCLELSDCTPKWTIFALNRFVDLRVK